MRGSRKTARLGPLRIGGGSPVMVQSMTNTDTRDIGATLGQIEKLASLGCEAIRVAVLDEQAAACLKELHDKSPVPLIADIHFEVAPARHQSHRGGLRGAAHQSRQYRFPRSRGRGCGLRQSQRRLHAHRRELRFRGEGYCLDKYGGPTPEAMVESCMKHVRMVEERGFGRYRAFREVLVRSQHHRLLPLPLEGCGLSPASRRDRGGQPHPRYGKERGGPRHSPERGHRRHHPRGSAHGQSLRGDRRGLRRSCAPSASGRADPKLFPAPPAGAPRSTSSALRRPSRSVSET